MHTHTLNSSRWKGLGVIPGVKSQPLVCGCWRPLLRLAGEVDIVAILCCTLDITNRNRWGNYGNRHRTLITYQCSWPMFLQYTIFKTNSNVSSIHLVLLHVLITSLFKHLGKTRQQNAKREHGLENNAKVRQVFMFNLIKKAWTVSILTDAVPITKLTTVQLECAISLFEQRITFVLLPRQWNIYSLKISSQKHVMASHPVPPLGLRPLAAQHYPPRSVLCIGRLCSLAE